MERGTGEARLEQGDHATLLQRRAPLIEDLMPSENREEQGLHATATREDMRRVRRAEGIDECSHVELADNPKHQRQVGYWTDLLNRQRHEALFLQDFQEGVS